jgi:hypothetical protein
MVKNHLALVFLHEIDPSYSEDEEVQGLMNDIHNFKEKDEEQLEMDELDFGSKPIGEQLKILAEEAKAVRETPPKNTGDELYRC